MTAPRPLPHSSGPTARDGLLLLGLVATGAGIVGAAFAYAVWRIFG